MQLWPKFFDHESQDQMNKKKKNKKTMKKEYNLKKKFPVVI